MPEYKPKPYPKMKHHEKEPPKTVGNEEEEKQLGSEWKDSPADVKKKEPEPQKVILTGIPKLNGDEDTLIESAEPGSNDEPAEPLGDITEPKSGKRKK